MPGFDGTGPAGGGAMSGWGRGYCSSSGAYAFRGTRRLVGPAMTYGRRGGYRNIYRQTGLPRWARERTGAPQPYAGPVYSQEDEIAMLQREAEALKADLSSVEQHLKDLNDESESKA